VEDFVAHTLQEKGYKIATDDEVEAACE